MAIMSSEEADLFDGVGKLDSVVCCAPALVKWIAEELRVTAEIDKAARKAREEKALARGTTDLQAPPLQVNIPKGGKGDKGDKNAKKEQGKG